MSSLTLASVNRSLAPPPAMQWAHDIRNALATVGLHLETLGRLSGARGGRVNEAAQAAMMRAAAMCDEAMAQAKRTDQSGRRRGFDIVATIQEVAFVLGPAAPDGFELRLCADGPCMVMADPGEIFRILFNLVHNAVALARKGGSIHHVTIALTRSGSDVTIRVSDDGPGLPKSVRARLFRPQSRASGEETNGFGLMISRELAERNGGMLRLAECAKGTTFILELGGVATVALDRGAAMPSLGRRAARA